MGGTLLSVLESGASDRLAVRTPEGDASLTATELLDESSRLAGALAGDFSPAGRLPVTFYKGVDQLPAFEDYPVANRYRGKPAVPRFGAGGLPDSDARARESVEVQLW